MRLVIGPCADSAAAETRNAARVASIIFSSRYLRLYACAYCGVKNSARLRAFRRLQMIQRFRAFSAILMRPLSPLRGRRRAGACGSAAPAAPARGPAGPTAPCGPGVTGKNIASDSRCFELRTYTVRAEGPGSIDLLHAVPRAHQSPVPETRHDHRRVLAAEELGHGAHADLCARVQGSRRTRRRMESVPVGSGVEKVQRRCRWARRSSRCS